MLKNFVYGFLILGAMALAGCLDNSDDGETPEGIIAHLPEPVTNNAVALVGDTVYSFAGLHAGKTWSDSTANAYACNLKKRKCRTIAPLPDGVGRLAATAVTVKEKIYIFGGYTIAEGGAEKSTPEVWVFNPKKKTYSRSIDMPVPVDDAVALNFADRYIILVSGWYDTDNVALVQVLDTVENRWFNTTQFPGAPVFGHAGAIHDNRLVVCGGVKIVPPKEPEKRRSFVLSNTCWHGDISADAQAINWRKLPGQPPGAAYRRAATTLPFGFVAFYGGTKNPYNYNGIGYNGEPSHAIPSMDVARLADDGGVHWRRLPAPAGMDYRGAVLWHDALITLGGMGEDQQVLDRVMAVSIYPSR